MWFCELRVGGTLEVCGSVWVVENRLEISSVELLSHGGGFGQTHEGGEGRV